MTLSVSIALATYNGARFLPAQLSSLVSQTRLPDELVVCDDGSSDSSVDILKEFAARAPFRVRIFCNAINMGYVLNFRQAMGLCVGDIIFLCDQDDVWFPEKIVTIARLFEDTPGVQAVVHDVSITTAELIPVHRTVLGRLRSRGMSGAADRHFLLGSSTVALQVKPDKMPESKWETFTA